MRGVTVNPRDAFRHTRNLVPPRVEEAPAHPNRTYLYVRQSTLRQVMENTTSTDRQYGLRQRAVALGWAPDQVVVIDEDLGRSGASAEGRDGFQRLVADVGMGKAGIVIGTEVSRLARNNADWHRLLEICALAETLILDEDGLYDPCAFNDRLLLGLKGQMSEAELHLSQGPAARRPAHQGPHRRAVAAAAGRASFMTAPGASCSTPTKAYATPSPACSPPSSAPARPVPRSKRSPPKGSPSPPGSRPGPNKGTLAWLPLRHHRALQVLHNPRYAGAFVYGRRRQRRGPDGRTRHSLQPRESWTVLIPDAHHGYISWDRVRGEPPPTGRVRPVPRRRTPRQPAPRRPRPAPRAGHLRPLRQADDGALPLPARCWSPSTSASAGASKTRPGVRPHRRRGHRRRIGQLLLATVTPLALEVALAVQAELEGRAAEADALRRQHVERARHAAEAARRRYLAVDPDNRLVAANLEADWNESLRALAAAQDEYERKAPGPRPSPKPTRHASQPWQPTFPPCGPTPAPPSGNANAWSASSSTTSPCDAKTNSHRPSSLQSRPDHQLQLPVGLPANEIRRTPARSSLKSTASSTATPKPASPPSSTARRPLRHRPGLQRGHGQPHPPQLRPRIRRDRFEARGWSAWKRSPPAMGVPQHVKDWSGKATRHRALNDKDQHYFQIPDVTPCKPNGRPPGTKNRQKPDNHRND